MLENDGAGDMEFSVGILGLDPSDNGGKDGMGGKLPQGTAVDITMVSPAIESVLCCAD